MIYLNDEIKSLFNHYFSSWICQQQGWQELQSHMFRVLWQSKRYSVSLLRRSRSQSRVMQKLLSQNCAIKGSSVGLKKNYLGLRLSSIFFRRKIFFLKLSRNKKDRKFFVAAPKVVPFLQLAAEKTTQFFLVHLENCGLHKNIYQ